MAPKAVACLRGEGAESEGPVGYVAVDSIAAGGRQAEPSRPPAASAESTELEAPGEPPAP